MDTQLEADFLRELAEVKDESMGWQPLEQGVYLPPGSDDKEVVITGQATVEVAPVECHVVLMKAITPESSHGTG